jgi:hypothetical protein
MRVLELSLIVGTALAGLTIASTAGSAMPSANPGFQNPNIHQARTICDQDGRCWNEHRNALAVVGVDRREYIGRWHDHRHDWHEHHGWDRDHRHFSDHPDDRGD